MMPGMNDKISPCRDCDSPDSMQVCPGCHHEFVCDLAQGKSRCWCMNLPAVLPACDGAKCLCEECLKRAIEGVQAQRAGAS